MNTPAMDIVLVNWNTRELLVNCLAAIPAAIAGRPATVWVVDNASSDDSVAVVEAQFPEVRLVRNTQNVGFSAANNQAIALSTAPYVLLLNSDTIPLPGSLAVLAQFLDTHAQVGIVGAQLLNPDYSLQPSWASFPTIWSELRGKNMRVRRPFAERNGQPAYDVDWVGGACLLIRRQVIEQIGPMDDGYFMYSEETDWCFRAHKAGWRICYYPLAQVIHFGGQSSKQASTRMKFELYRSKLRFFRLHYGRPRARMLAGLLQTGLAAKGALQLAAWAIRRQRVELTAARDTLTLAQKLAAYSNAAE